MTFSKNNLLESDYDWNEDVVSTGTQDPLPTRKRFDRFNGNNVLRMINLFNRLQLKISIPEGQQIEAMLANELPLTYSSEVSVFNWLKANMHKIAPGKITH